MSSIRGDAPSLRESDGVQLAGPAWIWVCLSCGKTHQDRYGVKGAGDRGWDESCMLNAHLCWADSLVRGPDGRVVSATSPTSESNRKDTP